MIKITQEELVRYLYNETSKQETAIKAALQTDMDLRETFEKLLSAQQSLNEINLSPEPQAVNKISKFALKNRNKFIPKENYNNSEFHSSHT